jgi:hypothetical protein
MCGGLDADAEGDDDDDADDAGKYASAATPALRRGEVSCSVALGLVFIVVVNHIVFEIHGEMIDFRKVRYCGRDFKNFIVCFTTYNGVVMSVICVNLQKSRRYEKAK